MNRITIYNLNDLNNKLKFLNAGYLYFFTKAPGGDPKETIPYKILGFSHTNNIIYEDPNSKKTKTHSMSLYGFHMEKTLQILDHRKDKEFKNYEEIVLKAFNIALYGALDRFKLDNYTISGGTHSLDLKLSLFDSKARVNTVYYLNYNNGLYSLFNRDKNFSYYKDFNPELCDFANKYLLFNKKELKINFYFPEDPNFKIHPITPIILKYMETELKVKVYDSASLETVTEVYLDGSIKILGSNRFYPVGTYKIQLYNYLDLPETHDINSKYLIAKSIFPAEVTLKEVMTDEDNLRLTYNKSRKNKLRFLHPFYADGDVLRTKLVVVPRSISKVSKFKNNSDNSQIADIVIDDLKSNPKIIKKEEYKGLIDYELMADSTVLIIDLAILEGKYFIKTSSAYLEYDNDNRLTVIIDEGDLDVREVANCTNLVDYVLHHQKVDYRGYAKKFPQSIEYVKLKK